MMGTSGRATIVIILIINIVIQIEGAGPLQLRVDPASNRIYDQYSRERYFHGTNVVYKRFPFHPRLDKFDAQHSLADDDLAFMHSLGYNTIRLGVLWAGAEPIKGQYNTTYYDIVASLVHKAGSQYGIYSLIDSHQDSWSEAFCGTGVPPWVAVAPFGSGRSDFAVPLTEQPVPTQEKGYSGCWLNNTCPSQDTCLTINNNDWPSYQFTTSLCSSVGAFYAGQFGLADAFAQYWRKTASVFATSNYIVGYELLNEPWAGNIYENIELLVPGVADREMLQPLYDKVAPLIASVDKSHLIFFQSVTWELLGLGEALGFTHVPGGITYANRSVLSIHNPAFGPVDFFYGLKLEEMKRLGCGGWVTETQNAPDFLDAADRFGFSWMHWDYKLFANITWDNPGLFQINGADVCKGNLTQCLDMGQVMQYVRVYPQAVSGTLQAYRFNPTTYEANIVYTINPNIAQPTEIAVPQKWLYPKGYTVNISPSGAATWKQVDISTIYIYHSPPISPVPLTIHIASN